VLGIKAYATMSGSIFSFKKKVGGGREEEEGGGGRRRRRRGGDIKVVG
jgi:hypothetical protein